MRKFILAEKLQKLTLLFGLVYWLQQLHIEVYISRFELVVAVMPDNLVDTGIFYVVSFLKLDQMTFLNTLSDKRFVLYLLPLTLYESQTS